MVSMLKMNPMIFSIKNLVKMKNEQTAHILKKNAGPVSILGGLFNFKRREINREYEIT